MLITGNCKLQAVTKMCMILVIIKTFKELFRDLYYRNMTVDDAESKQNEFDGVLGALSEYSTKKKNILKQRLSP